jgi:hypothetical protein
MHWIINNPVDAFMLLWALVLKPVLLFSIVTLVCAYVVIKQGWLSRKQTLYVSLIVITIFSVSVTAVKVYGYYNPSLSIEDGHENYASHFNDVQRKQIGAAQKYGITPLKDRNQVDAAIIEDNLVHIVSCKNYQLAPMTHSVPYLTDNAFKLLNTIGANFKDSLNTKGLKAHKIVVTSILRTDQDVEKLMMKNPVAVKNSAHRYATTFDISYTQFVPIGLTAKTDRNVLKKVLAEVLRDLRDEKHCYIKYEKSQNCFHITVRR